MTPAEGEPERTTAKGMRAIMVVGGGLVTAATLQLFVLSTATDRFGAWTIKPSLSSACLGAFYGGAAVIALLSARERLWARAGIALAPVTVFVWLTLVATLLHLDKLHLTEGPTSARIAAWVWLVVYVVEPPVLTASYLAQRRRGGIDPVGGPLVRRSLCLILGAAAVLTLTVGAALFFAPQLTAKAWPWPLTPLVSRVAGAWFVGFGLMLVAMVRERDGSRLRIALVGIAVAAVLHLLAVTRFTGTLDWSRPISWAYVLYFAGLAAAGLYGLFSISADASQLDRG